MYSIRLKSISIKLTSTATSDVFPLCTGTVHVCNAVQLLWATAVVLSDIPDSEPVWLLSCDLKYSIIFVTLMLAQLWTAVAPIAASYVNENLRAPFRNASSKPRHWRFPNRFRIWLWRTTPNACEFHLLPIKNTLWTKDINHKFILNEYEINSFLKLIIVLDSSLINQQDTCTVLIWHTFSRIIWSINVEFQSLGLMPILLRVLHSLVNVHWFGGSSYPLEQRALSVLPRR